MSNDLDQPGLVKRLKVLEKQNRALKSAVDDYRGMVDKYRTLAECSLAGIYVVQAGRLVYVNPRFVEMLGYNREEDLVGREFWEIVHPRDRAPDSIPGTDEESEKPIPARFTFRARKKSGTTVWLDLRGAHARYLGRRASIGTVVDVTEQKEAEEALRLSEEKYRAIIDHIEDGYYEVDPRGNLVAFNDAFARILGYSRQELLGLGYSGYASPEQTCLINQTFNQVYATGRPRKSVAWEIIRKDGSVRHLDLSVSLVKDQESRRIGFRGIARDITERKMAERQLTQHRSQLEELVQERTAALTGTNEALQQEILERHKAESKLLREKRFTESVVDSLPGAFYVFDESGHLLRWNENLRNLTDYGIEELTEKFVLDFFVEQDRDRVMASVAETFAKGRAVVEANVLAKDGRTTPYYFSAVSTRLDGLTCMVGVGIDISEKREFEKALVASEKELRVLSSQLISAQEEERRRVALELHDGVGQALTATKFALEGTIKIFSRRLEAQQLNMLQGVIPTLQRAIDEVRRMSMDLRPSMLDDLGLLSTVTWLCRDFQRIYRRIVMEKQFDIMEEEIPDHLKIVIYRIVQEALNNVVKHSRADQVAVTIEKKDRHLNLQISDRGLGFDLGSALNVEASQRGLGLASMKERTELSGGLYTLRTAPGWGTSIRARWPLEE